MIHAISAEWGKTWSVRSPMLCLLSTVLLVVLTAASLANDFVHGIGIGEHPADATVPAASNLGPAIQFGLLTFTAFAMTLMTSEYTTGSIRTTFQAEPRRGVVLASKTLIGLLVGLVMGAVVGALGLAASDLALQGHSAIASESAVVTVTRVSGVFALAAVLVVALGAIIRSAVGTLAAGIMLLVGALALPTSVSVWTPAGGAGQFLEASDEHYPSVVGLVVIAVWAAVAYAVAAWLLRRRDA
jgi:ABC-2 type transport system permease protein